MRPDEYKIMHAQEAHHWWFRGRRILLADLLERARSASAGRILDFGSGTGGNIAMERRVGEVFGIEPDAGALNLARSQEAAHFSRAVGTALPFRDGSFDLVLASDVLEHIPNDALASREIYRVLRAGGRLVFSVPAHPWLFGPHDTALQHQRRYTRLTIRQVLEGAGFRLSSLSYWNTTLFPVAVAARLARRLGKAEARSDTRDVSPWLNRVLTGVLGLEARALRLTRLPWGVSLVGIADRV